MANKRMIKLSLKVNRYTVGYVFYIPLIDRIKLLFNGYIDCFVEIEEG